RPALHAERRHRLRLAPGPDPPPGAGLDPAQGPAAHAGPRPQLPVAEPDPGLAGPAALDPLWDQPGAAGHGDALDGAAAAARAGRLGAVRVRRRRRRPGAAGPPARLRHDPGALRLLGD